MVYYQAYTEMLVRIHGHKYFYNFISETVNSFQHILYSFRHILSAI